MKKKPPKPSSIPYYIEKVVCYRTEYETRKDFKDGYPPVVAELLLSILISVRAIRFSALFLLGVLLALAIR